MVAVVDLLQDVSQSLLQEETIAHSGSLLFVGTASLSQMQQLIELHTDITQQSIQRRYD